MRTRAECTHSEFETRPRPLRPRERESLSLEDATADGACYPGGHFGGNQLGSVSTGPGRACIRLRGLTCTPRGFAERELLPWAAIYHTRSASTYLKLGLSSFFFQNFSLSRFLWGFSSDFSLSRFLWRATNRCLCVRYDGGRAKGLEGPLTSTHHGIGPSRSGETSLKAVHRTRSSRLPVPRPSATGD